MSRVSAGCKRISIDIPTQLHERIVALANDPPALPLAEWARRVLAHYADYPLPSLAERTQANTRLDGKERMPNIVQQRELRKAQHG